MNLEQILLEYKNLTLELIEYIGDVEKTETLIGKRQQIIENINSSSYEKSRFKEIAESLNLVELEKDLLDKMKRENVNTKKALDNVRRLKKARTMYNRENDRPAFFNMVSY